MRYLIASTALFLFAGSAWSQFRFDTPKFEAPRIPSPGEVIGELDKKRREAQKELETAVNRGKEGLEKLERTGSEQAKKVAEEAKRELEKAQDAANRGIDDLASNGKKAVEDTYRNLAKSANDLVQAGKAAERFIEREISGYGETLSAAEKRARQGKIVDALWHLHTEPLSKTSEHAADAATESELLGQAMQGAATFYGGPAGAAAYAAWLTYQKTGNADMALRVGIATGVQSYISAQAGAMPQGTAGELAKKALVTGAAGGIAVAASGGDDAAVREAFLKQGGMVMMQGGKSYITKKFDAAAGPIDSFCTSATGVSCKPLLNAVQRDADGNILFDDRGYPKIDNSKLLPARANLGKWTDGNKVPKVSASLPGINSLTLLKGQWAISWDRALLTSRSVNAPAIALTYVGPASPYVRKVEELNAALGKAQVGRVPAAPAATPTKPEMWVALGDVGAQEAFFTRMFVRSREALSVGDIVRATRDVNARPAPAAWDKPTYVLPRNAVIVIGEIQDLPTKAGPKQRWARLDLDADQ